MGDVAGMWCPSRAKAIRREDELKGSGREQQGAGGLAFMVAGDSNEQISTHRRVAIDRPEKSREREERMVGVKEVKEQRGPP